MIWYLPTCLALHHTSVHFTRAMLAFCIAPKTYFLFPTLEKSPILPSDFFPVIFRFQFHIFLRKLPDSPGILPLSHVCFHRSLYFSFIEIIMYLLKYIIHLMLVSVCQQNLGRKRSCSCLCAVLTTVLTLSSFSTNVHLMNSLNICIFSHKEIIHWIILK